MTAPKKSEVHKQLDELLGKSPIKTGGRQCTCCTEPYRDSIRYVLDQLILTQRVISCPQIHQTVKGVHDDFPVGPDSLLHHLQRHEGDRWDRVNVYRRGPLIA